MLVSKTLDSDLRCGAYDGKGAPGAEEHDVAVIVGGVRIIDFEIEPINDLLWHEDAA